MMKNVYHSIFNRGFIFYFYWTCILAPLVFLEYGNTLETVLLNTAGESLELLPHHRLSCERLFLYRVLALQPIKIFLINITFRFAYHTRKAAQKEIMFADTSWFSFLTTALVFRIASSGRSTQPRHLELPTSLSSLPTQAGSPSVWWSSISKGKFFLNHPRAQSASCKGKIIEYWFLRAGAWGNPG